jgi:DNA-binding transcriptional ArsR family regulator
MLRIHFRPEDLARTHVAVNMDELWETVLSLQLLHSGTARLIFQGWRDAVRGRMPHAAHGILLSLVAPVGDFPDFLTPATGTLGLATALESVKCTPRSQIRRDLSHVAAARHLPQWCRGLADGDVQTLDRVAGALRAWHTAAVAPDRERIEAALGKDRALRLRDARLGGPDRLLAGLPPPLQWQPPVLTTHYPHDRDVHLEGRGLLLVPSFFCLRRPITFINAELPPVLVYPVEHELSGSADGCGGMDAGGRALAALLGSTRAAILDAIGGGALCTGEIARKVGVSAPSASEHCAVLRGGGLIVSHRLGNSVLHSISQTGAALLNGTNRTG